MNNDIRAALERLVRAYDTNEGLPIAEWIATARAALTEPVGEGPILQWTENMPPSEDCRYDHCTAETPFGRFLISWKSWKQFDSPTVDETPWGDWYGAFNSVDAAKAACQKEMDERLALSDHLEQSAPDQVIVRCPETCLIEIRRIADGKVIYSNYRKGDLRLPINELPAEPPAPAGGLVEKLTSVWNYGQPLHPAAARAAIREVAAWLDERGMYGCSLWIREEADRCP